MTDIAHPCSVSPKRYLQDYCGGFALITDRNCTRHWIHLESVDDRTGVKIGGTLREGEIMWDKGESLLAIPYHIEGIMVFERGGQFEMFGNVIADKHETLIMRYTPFDRFGRPLAGVPAYVHHFYIPGSSMVPKDVIHSFQECAIKI